MSLISLKNRIHNGKCPECDTVIPGGFEVESREGYERQRKPSGAGSLRAITMLIKRWV